MPDQQTGIDLASQTGQQNIASAISNLSGMRITLENVDKDWELIASNALTATWNQRPQTFVFLLSYNTQFCLQAVFINTNNKMSVKTIVTSNNYGDVPLLSYDGTTNTVSATFATANYAKVKR